MAVSWLTPLPWWQDALVMLPFGLIAMWMNYREAKRDDDFISKFIPK